jgi:hypothetical protein
MNYYDSTSQVVERSKMVLGEESLFPVKDSNFTKLNPHCSLSMKRAHVTKVAKEARRDWQMMSF